MSEPPCRFCKTSILKLARMNDQKGRMVEQICYGCVEVCTRLATGHCVNCRAGPDAGGALIHPSSEHSPFCSVECRMRGGWARHLRDLITLVRSLKPVGGNVLTNTRGY